MDIICNRCDKKFSNTQNLYKHMRNVHKVEPEISGKSICSVCSKTVRGHKDLLKHMQEEHETELPVKEITFSTMEDFNSWKKNLELETQSAYMKPRASVTRQDMTIYSKFCCSREGPYRTRAGEVRKRKLKRMGSVKTGTACPSFIQCFQGEEIKVFYQPIHVGHDEKIGRLLSSQENSVKIAKKCEGVPINKTLKIEPMLLNEHNSEQESTFVETSSTFDDMPQDSMLEKLQEKLQYMINYLNTNSMSVTAQQELCQKIDCAIAFMHNISSASGDTLPLTKTNGPTNTEVNLKPRVFFPTSKRIQLCRFVKKPTNGKRIILVEGLGQDKILSARTQFDHTY